MQKPKSVYITQLHQTSLWIYQLPILNIYSESLMKSYTKESLIYGEIKPTHINWSSQIVLILQDTEMRQESTEK